MTLSKAQNSPNDLWMYTHKNLSTFDHPQISTEISPFLQLNFEIFLRSSSIKRPLFKSKKEAIISCCDSVTLCAPVILCNNMNNKNSGWNIYDFSWQRCERIVTLLKGFSSTFCRPDVWKIPRLYFRAQTQRDQKREMSQFMTRGQNNHPVYGHTRA